MCLNVVSERKPKAKGRGYKVVGRKLSKGRFSNFCYGNDGIRMRVWHEAHEEPIKKHLLILYTSGFHIYTTRRAGIAALNIWGLNLLEVKYEGAHTRGYQDGLPVVVAKRMKPVRIIKEAK